MMNLEAKFIERMQESDLLTGLLPGGMYSALELAAVGKLAEISRKSTPEAFDENGELLPCVFVKMGVDVPRGPYADSVATPVQLFFYQQYTAQAVHDAVVIAFALFNYSRIGTGSWRVELGNVSWNQTDDVLNANLNVLRFDVIRRMPIYEGGS